MGDELEIVFFEHPAFLKEIKRINKKYDGGNGYRHLKQLLKIHFHPTDRKICFSPQALKRLDNVGANVEVYKVNMAIKGLRHGQFPRVCFRVEGNLITFMCQGNHIENYKHDKLLETVKERIKELDPDIILS